MGTDGFVRAANLGVVVNDTASTPVVLAVEGPFGWVPTMFIGAAVGDLSLHDVFRLEARCLVQSCHTLCHISVLVIGVHGCSRQAKILEYEHL